MVGKGDNAVNSIVSFSHHIFNLQQSYPPFRITLNL